MLDKKKYYVLACIILKTWKLNKKSLETFNYIGVHCTNYNQYMLSQIHTLGLYWDVLVQIESSNLSQMPAFS